LDDQIPDTTVGEENMKMIGSMMAKDLGLKTNKIDDTNDKMMLEEEEEVNDQQIDIGGSE